MGEVYEARDTRLGRTVALKILPPELASDSRRLRRFQQEARIASQLSHPGITHLYEVEEENGLHYLTMEFVEGRTLEERMKQGPVSPSEALDLAIQAASALEAAHAKNVVHRDIKPANMMITGSGRLKLLDFGLAKAHVEAADAPDTKTETGAVLGTVQYMSPEQALGEAVDGRSDLFSLGIVLYEMLTGRRPFSGAGQKGVLNQIVTASPGPLTLPEGEAYQELAQVVEKCLRKEREERYQSAQDLAADLARVRRLLSSGGASGELHAHDIEFRLPRNPARVLFLLLQSVYLVMYVASLQWSGGMVAGMEHMLGNAGEKVSLLLIGVAILGIAVRLYLISSVALDHVETGVRYRKAFPVFFLLDELWCLAPFGLSLKMGELLALACVAPLAFSPFSQRTLIRSAYDLHTPRRRSM